MIGGESFWVEVFAIFLADVLASFFVVAIGYAAWYVLKYPGFYIGANWRYYGWNFPKMQRFPNETDTEAGEMRLVASIVVQSYDSSVKKVIASVWVRERADPANPGNILGHRSLLDDFRAENRTTGGDLLRFDGPSITCPASKFQYVVNCPIFIETSDGAFYRAASLGNAPRVRVVRLRNFFRRNFARARRQVFALRDYIKQRF